MAAANAPSSYLPTQPAPRPNDRAPAASTSSGGYASYPAGKSAQPPNVPAPPALNPYAPQQAPVAGNPYAAYGQQQPANPYGAQPAPQYGAPPAAAGPYTAPGQDPMALYQQQLAAYQQSYGAYPPAPQAAPNPYAPQPPNPYGAPPGPGAYGAPPYGAPPAANPYGAPGPYGAPTPPYGGPPPNPYGGPPHRGAPYGGGPVSGNTYPGGIKPNVPLVEQPKVFVGGLPYDIKNDVLLAAFERYGALSASIVTDKETGASKGFGFVGFADDFRCAEAFRGMQGATVAGRVIRLGTTQKKSDRDASKDPGGIGSFGRSGPPARGGGGY